MYLLSKKRVRESLEKSGVRIRTRQSLHRFIAEHWEAWAQHNEMEEVLELESASPSKVANALTKAKILESITLKFPYRAVTRYLWGDAPTFSLIQSVDDEGYFSHYTAMEMHGLTDQIPKAIYFNVEQPATGGGGLLTQEGIDRAFKGKCRVTNNVIQFREFTVHKINGQNTGRLGVISKRTSDDSVINVTDLERTLIDIAVRPIYSGGVAEVANAFRSAAPNVSANRLATYLTALNYTYPYHQAIGFYMEKAGNYSDAQIRKMQALPINFNFYLTYQLKNPSFNEKWRLFVPKGF
jgi:predicted transcriptional regulator of viral defense system